MLHALGVLPLVDQDRAQQALCRAHIQAETCVARVGGRQSGGDRHRIAQCASASAKRLCSMSSRPRYLERDAAVSLVAHVGGILGVQRIEPGKRRGYDFQRMIVFFPDERAAQLALRTVQRSSRRRGRFRIRRYDLFAKVHRARVFLLREEHLRQIVLGFEAGWLRGRELAGGLQGAFETGALFAIGVEQLCVAEVSERELVAQRGVARIGRD